MADKGLPEEISCKSERAPQPCPALATVTADQAVCYSEETMTRERSI